MHQPTGVEFASVHLTTDVMLYCAAEQRRRH